MSGGWGLAQWVSWLVPSERGMDGHGQARTNTDGMVKEYGVLQDPPPCSFRRPVSRPIFLDAAAVSVISQTWRGSPRHAVGNPRAALARGRKRVGIPRGCAAVTGDETRDEKPLPPQSGGKAAGTRTIRKPEDDPRHASQSNFSAQGKVKRCFAGRFSGSDSPHPRQRGWGFAWAG